MTQSYFSKPNKLYVRIFLVLLSMVVLIISVVSMLLYINFEDVALNLIQSYAREDLSKASYSAKLMSDSARMLALQMIQDNNILGLIRNSSDEDALVNSKNRMNSYLNTSPLIHSIYIYTAPTGLIFSTETNHWMYERSDFFDKEIFSIIDKNQKTAPFTPIPRTVHEKISANFETTYNVYTFMLFEWKNTPLESNNIIILNISEDWLRHTMNSLNSDSSSDSFIIDNKGRAVISTSRYGMLSDISNESYIQTIVNAKTNSGYFVDSINGKKSLISYVSSDLFGWKFISVIPYENITKKIQGITRLTVIIAACILLVGFLLSYLLSKNLYKPINSVFTDLKKLEREKKDNQYALRQEFLRNIILTRTKYNLEDIFSKFTDMKIEIPAQGEYILMLLKIDNYSDFCSNNDCNDRNLLRFAISNIASEHAANFSKNECVDMLEDHIVLILDLESNISKSGLMELSKCIQDSVHEYLGLSLSIIFTTKSDSMANIGGIYHKALDASCYRIFAGRKCILDASDTCKYSSNEYTYPAQKERLLIEALMLGRMEDVKTLHKEIVETSFGYPYLVFNMTTLHLAFSISTAIDIVEESSGREIPYSLDDFITKLNKFETLEEINNHFYQMFQQVALSQQDRMNLKHGTIIARVIDIINNNYMDQSLSMESIAPIVDMSPAYLGRMFKKATSKSILHYLTELRIEKAMEFLSCTTEPISDIATKVGFVNSSYFFTVFKKVRGITPTEYRVNNSHTSYSA